MTYPYDLGNFTWNVTTGVDKAQTWFNRGMAWCYAFHHEEAIACFEKALDLDPSCGMAHWGIAYAIGPNYNKPWEAFDDDEREASLKRATQALATAETAHLNALEQALLAALAARYPQDSSETELATFNDNYADAMRDVYRTHGDDLNIAALFAEALMNRTPWELWDLVSGKPNDGASAEEAITVMESAFAKSEEAMQHPGLLHMYVHLMEMSPHPERALKAGDNLVNLVPDAGHLVHMPTHIDVLCGHYQNVVTRNSAAIDADRKHLDRAGPLNFYSLYRCHNYHFKTYGAMFLGQYGPAIEAAEDMLATLPAELLRTESPPMADWLEGFVPTKQHVFIRFGQWDRILEQPFPDDRNLFCVTTATMHYARTVALAATGHVDAAAAEQEAFLAAKSVIPESRMVFNNTCLDILAVAEEMLKGELEYRRGNFDVAFAHLRRSVEIDDALPYDEPWGWMQPTRHALGALLLEQGHYDEAEAIYRADLGLDNSLRRACQHPDNVWSLHGLYECLIERGDTTDAPFIKQRLDLAKARADVPIHASCFCRQEAA